MDETDYRTHLRVGRSKEDIAAVNRLLRHGGFNSHPTHRMKPAGVQTSAAGARLDGHRPFKAD